MANICPVKMRLLKINLIYSSQVKIVTLDFWKGKSSFRHDLGVNYWAECLEIPWPASWSV